MTFITLFFWDGGEVFLKKTAITLGGGNEALGKVFKGSTPDPALIHRPVQLSHSWALGCRAGGQLTTLLGVTFGVGLPAAQGTWLPACSRRQSSTLGQASPAPISVLFLLEASAVGHFGPIQLRTDFWDRVGLRDHCPAHFPESPKELFLSPTPVGQGLWVSRSTFRTAAQTSQEGSTSRPRPPLTCSMTPSWNAIATPC